jgi:hypothetical protein
MRRFMFVAVILVLLTQAAPCQADIVLGAAADYGVLIEPNVASFQLNNSTIFGNVGLGTGVSPVQIASNGFIKPIPTFAGTGRLDLVDASATISNPGNVSGGVHFNQSQVTTALNTVNALNSTFGAEAGTALTISGGGQTVNVSAGMLDASGNRIFSLTASSYNNNNQGFTVVGTASDFVVFNIANGTSNENIGGPISLSGGITPDQVLFNFVGTSGNLGGSAGGATVNGIFLAPNMKVNIDNIIINGRLFGGRAGTDFQTVSGFELNQPDPKPDVGPGPGPDPGPGVDPGAGGVPEPSTLLLGSTGLGVLGLYRLWVRRRAG